MSQSEYYSNNAKTTLIAGYTAGSGVLTVTSTAGSFPASAPFHVTVYDDTTNPPTLKVILEVTAITDSTHFAVTAEGTDANASSGNNVYQCLTKVSIDRIKLDARLAPTTVSLTAQTSNIGSTNLQISGAVVPAGLYKVAVYTRTSSAGSAGTLAVTIGWNDGGGAVTDTPIVAMDLSSLVSSSGQTILKADGVNNITYSTTITGGSGSPQYSLDIALERIS